MRPAAEPVTASDARRATARVLAVLAARGRMEAPFPGVPLRRLGIYGSRVGGRGSRGHPSDECHSRGRVTRPGHCYTRRRDAGWSSQVARRAHNPEVAGSNPAPATAKGPGNGAFLL